MLSQFALLDLVEALLIARVAFEGERVERVLGVLFVVDVIDSISPVGERLLVARLTQNRLSLVLMLSDLLQFWFDFELFVGGFRGGAQVHSMWVDDFRFLF